MNKLFVKIKFYILYETVEISNFHFSHYKSIETLSCHSNQSSYPTRINYITFVEGNVLCKYAKFQLHPSYDFEKKNFEYFSKIYPGCGPVNQLNTAIWIKVVLNKYFCKKKSNIPNDLAEIVNFHFSHYKSMGTISCHSNQSFYPTRIKTQFM